MKKLVSLALSLILWTSAFAQESPLVSTEFWKGKPSLDQVQAEWDKGFSYAQVVGADDPLALAVSHDAPIEVVKFLENQPGLDLTRKLHEGRIYIHLSANSGHVAATDYLLEKGSPINYLDANGHTAFTFAGFQGNLTVPMAEVFLKHGIDVNAQYPEKLDATILLISILYDKDLSLTDYFISKGASINAVDNEGNTAFNYAAQSGDVQILKALNQRGAQYDEGALIKAAKGTYRTYTTVDVHQYLVDELGLSPKVETKEGENLLNLVTKKQNQTETVKFYLEKGVDAGKVDQEGNTPFLNAAGGKDLETVELLFKSVKDINAPNKKGVTPLIAAVQNSNAAVVSFLLDKGADVQVKDAEGNSLIYYLAESFRTGGRGRGGNPQMAIQDFQTKMTALKNSGLDLTEALFDGNTLYHLLAEKNNLDVLKTLENEGISINAVNQDGMTALHKAALVSSDDKILKYLVSLGADKSIATEFEETAYTLAKENEQLSRRNISVEFLK